MRNFHMAYLAVAFALGVWAAKVLSLGGESFGLALAIFAVVAWFLKRIRWLSAILLLGCFAALGALRFSLYNELPSDHYSHYIGSDRRAVFQLKVVALDKVTAKYFRYTAEVKAVSRDGVFVSTNGLVSLQAKRQPTTGQWSAGAKLWVNAKLTDPPGRVNPFQFDYQEYLVRKQIRHQLFVGKDQWVMSGRAGGVRQKINMFKTHLTDRLRRAGFAERELTIFRALLLGDRTEMGADLRTQYARAGAMHFLAISGLHVGIVFSIVYLLLYPLVWLPRGKLWRIVCALAAIWCFAFFVDFSPSVSRASLMLSVYYFFVLTRRRSDLYHALALSALILLSVRPNYLFDVGFQLSYLAVFFIAYLYKTLRRWLCAERSFLDYPLGLLSITLAAQLGTMPVSLYYFHCFPTLFLLCSLALTPLMFLLLGLGMLALILVALDAPALWVFNSCESLLFGMNVFIDKLASWQWEPFNKIFVSPLMAILMYVGIGFFRNFLQSGQGKWAVGLLTVFFSTSLLYVWDVYEKWGRREVVIFQNFNALIGVKARDTLDLYSEDPSKASASRRWLIDPYVIGMRISRVNYFSLDEKRTTTAYLKTKNIIQTDRFKLLIADPLWRFDSVPWESFDYVWMRKSRRSPSLKRGFPEQGQTSFTGKEDLFKTKNGQGMIEPMAEDLARVLSF